MKEIKRNKDWIQDYFFLIVPKPLKDELLSSWLTRMAKEHRRLLSEFISLFIRHDGSAIARTDIDFLYNEELFEHLVQKSHLSYKGIFNLSLRSEEGYLYTCSEHDLYPPLQIRKLTDKRMHNGLMYCPQCLAEDNVPYFRKQWRYHSINVCTKHRVLLLDRCLKCHSKIELSKIKHFKELSICHKCENDLRLGMYTYLESNFEYAIQATKWFENGLKNGYFIINQEKVYSVFVFGSFQYLRCLLDKKEKLVLNYFPLIDEYKRICSNLEHYNFKENLSIKKELMLTSMVYSLFQNYPYNLIEFALSNKLTHRAFVHRIKDIPFWYKKMIDELIPICNNIGREISESEVRGAIKYLKSTGKVVNQKNVGGILGCHLSLHRGFISIYKSLKI
ncbi:MAG: TniQ family protein [Sulfurimonadaceae bacterium]